MLFVVRSIEPFVSHLDDVFHEWEDIKIRYYSSWPNTQQNFHSNQQECAVVCHHWICLNNWSLCVRHRLFNFEGQELAIKCHMRSAIESGLHIMPIPNIKYLQIVSCNSIPFESRLLILMFSKILWGPHALQPRTQLTKSYWIWIAFPASLTRIEKNFTVFKLWGSELKETNCT